MELTAITNKQIKLTPTIPLHHFSNMLGYFPSMVHRLPPMLNLALGQSVATKFDLTWLEITGPKGLALSQIAMSKVTSDIQRGMIKTYLTIFLLTLTLALLLTLT